MFRSYEITMFLPFIFLRTLSTFLQLNRLKTRTCLILSNALELLVDSYYRPKKENVKPGVYLETRQ